MSPIGRQKENNRCHACVWLDKSLQTHKCFFSVDYPGEINLFEFRNRVMQVNAEQQVNLAEPFRRFVL